MATRTFLELVNDVLTELREPVVTSVTATDYSTLIARFVNSAKRAVEDSWKWSALRTTIGVTTVAGTTRYTLTGSTERFDLIPLRSSAWNKTKNWPLELLNRSVHRELMHGDFTDTTGIQTGSPDSFSFVETFTSGQQQIDVFPVPTGVESLKFFGYNPPADWTSGSDICYIPYGPIVQLAVALARGERGEDGGISTAEQTVFAAKFAADAIAIDAQRYSEDSVWEAV